MAKKIAVIGATGTQGGGVVKALLQSGDWKVRAITRNTSSDKARALASSGAEVVAANTDAVDSLIEAFEGVQAIFAVTNFWELMYKGNDARVSGKLEQQQGINIAIAASKTASLEHYIFSTQPSPKRISGGKYEVSHMDHKEEVDNYIRKKLPDLAKKTTFLWLGYYPSNMTLPMSRAIAVPGTQTYLFVVPTPASAYIPVSGEVSNNTGIFVKAILANPTKSQGRYANIKTETITHGELIKAWETVTGKKARLIHTSKETFTHLWGPAGAELADQYIWAAEYPDWEIGNRNVATVKELGIGKGELIGLQENLENLKDLLV